MLAPVGIEALPLALKDRPVLAQQAQRCRGNGQQPPAALRLGTAKGRLTTYDLDLLADLQRRRIPVEGVHLGTIIVLVGILAIITSTFVSQQPPSPLWIALYFVVLYRPMERFGLRLLPATMNTARTYQPLHEAATKLTATLDTVVLVNTICDGIRATFGQPAHAFYLGHVGRGSHDLTQVRQERLPSLPTIIPAGTLTHIQQREGKQMIEHLYDRLQQERDTTAAAIARELHDEVININVRLNIESLQKLIGQTSDPLVQKELEELLESEHTMAETLRTACKRLYPTGTNDPFGLASLLRMQAERILVAWPGVFRLDVEAQLWR